MKLTNGTLLVAALGGAALMAGLGAGAGGSGAGNLGADLGPYLVAFYDANPDDGEEAEIWLINPTSSDLEALAVIYGDGGEPVNCVRELVGPNDFEKFAVGGQVDEGIVKIVTVAPGGGTLVLQSGLVAWIRHETEGENSALADTQAKYLPVGLLRDNNNYELNRIVSYVDENCPAM
jgi:hypothetical protein